MKHHVAGKVFRLTSVAVVLLIAFLCFAGTLMAEDNFLVTSPTVESGGVLDAKHTCDGESVTPELNWTGVPAGTKSFALNLWHNAHDQLKTYWVLYNIPGDAEGIPEKVENIGTLGYNDKGIGYDPMCSKGSGVKEYNITVYALFGEPTFTDSKVTREVLLKAIEDITLAEDTLTFTYERSGAPSGGEGRGGGDQQGPPPGEEGRGNAERQGPPPEH